MYIDRYEIVSYSRKWNNGKQNKKAEVTNYCDNTYHGMSGKKFLNLLEDLDNAITYGLFNNANEKEEYTIDKPRPIPDDYYIVEVKGIEKYE